jgi:hypothetical protein
MKGSTVEFVLLMVCAVCGVGAASGLVVLPVGVAGLLCSSWPRYLILWDRAKDVGRHGAVRITMAASALNALVAVGAAYGLGLATRLVFSGLAH